MKLELILPNVMLVLQVVSSFIYAYQGAWGYAGYWFSGAAITFCVTYLVGRV